MSHLLGLSAFMMGTLGWVVTSQISGIHPAYGGPDPGRLFLVMLTIVCACLILSGLVMVDSIRANRMLRMIYGIPPVGFVLYAISLLFDLG